MKKPEPKGTTQPRRSTGARATVIGERDRRILRLIYEHRFLDTELLWYLIRPEPSGSEYRVGTDGKRRPRKYGFGLKALYKRLRQLSQSRYLETHLSLPHPKGKGVAGTRYAYGLGSKSAPVVAELTGLSAKQVQDIVAANKVKTAFIQHALEVARFRVILELACRDNDRVRLMFWEQGIMLQDWIDGEDEQGEEIRLSVYPDAFFGLEVAGKGMAHYFLEIDRSTMTIVASNNARDIKKKLMGFMFYRKAKRHSARYCHRTLPDGTVVGIDVVNRRPLDDDYSSSELPPIKSFRVLFVAPGATAGKLSERGRVANILSAFPSFGKQYSTSTLFWFASLDSFDLEQPDSIFSHLWLTPNPEHELKSLIE